MSDNHFSFADEQLFAELSPEEGAAISGGAEYRIKNDTTETRYVYGFDSMFEPKEIQLKPGEEKILSLLDEKGYLVYDKKHGPMFELSTKEIAAGGLYRLSRTGDIVDLIAGKQTLV